MSEQVVKMSVDEYMRSVTAKWNRVITMRIGETTEYGGKMHWMRQANPITVIFCVDKGEESQVIEIDSRVDQFKLDIQKRDKRIKIGMEGMISKERFWLNFSGKMKDGVLSIKDGMFGAEIKGTVYGPHDKVTLMFVDKSRRKVSKYVEKNNLEETISMSIRKEYYNN